MTAEPSTRISYVVSGTDVSGAEQEWTIEASSVESAARKAQGHGMTTVRSVVTQAERDAQAAAPAKGGIRDARVVEFSTLAAFWFGAVATVGSIIVWLLVYVVLRTVDAVPTLLR